MAFLPLFFDVSSHPIIVVGDGPQATAKLHLLCAAGASVRWFTPSIGGQEQALVAGQYAGRVGMAVGEPNDDDLCTAFCVVSAVGGDTDERIARQAKLFNVPVNVVDRPELSTFIFPAIVGRGAVVVAIGTNGASPVVARRLREQIEAILPTRIGDLVSLIGRYRSHFASTRHASRSLRRFWERVIDGPVGAAALAGRWREAEEGLKAAIKEAQSPEEKSGVVHLVGAGPGDPDLLTLRALQALQNADVVFYDELVTPEILNRARRDAERVFVGKRRNEPGIGQDAINRRLVEAARQGHQVVRLKGGDPFIFGRGGEELEYLRTAGVPVVTVPGVTAALGCAAEAGLPLTFRNEASSVHFVTAQRSEEMGTMDWTPFAGPQATVVVYMGLAAAGSVRDGLIAAGRDPRTPAAVLARGTRPDAKSIVGHLEDITSLAAAAGDGPALLVVGDVVARSDAWRVRAATPSEAAA
jgi:uroporphyrin-III C-methyltransferase/precorrin-2 dehydrogenase/sirohydrochlorin ferrochelatase